MNIEQQIAKDCILAALKSDAKIKQVTHLALLHAPNCNEYLYTAMGHEDISNLSYIETSIKLINLILANASDEVEDTEDEEVVNEFISDHTDFLDEASGVNLEINGTKHVIYYYIDEHYQNNAILIFPTVLIEELELQVVEA